MVVRFGASLTRATAMRLLGDGGLPGVPAVRRRRSRRTRSASGSRPPAQGVAADAAVVARLTVEREPDAPQPVRSSKSTAEPTDRYAKNRGRCGRLASSSASRMEIKRVGSQPSTRDPQTGYWQGTD